MQPPLKISKPYLGAAITSVTLVAGALVAAATPGPGACLTFSMISCELEWQVDQLEDLKLSDTLGARAAVISTVGQYNLDEDFPANDLAEIYRQIDSASSGCVISTLQGAVRDKIIKFHASVARPDTASLVANADLPKTDQAIQLENEQQINALTPVFNSLNLCVVGTFPIAPADSMSSPELECEADGKDPSCIHDSNPGLLDDLGLEKISSRTTDEDDGSPEEEQNSQPPRESTQPSPPDTSDTEEEPSESAVPREPTLEVTPTPPAPSVVEPPLPDPTYAPYPELSEPPRTTPPEYAEKPRPVPTTDPLPPEEGSDETPSRPSTAPSATESREGFLSSSPPEDHVDP